MTNWNKLKVTELKEELKNRGLPQNGLKAALVARLEEADAGAGAGAEVESEATIGEESVTQDGSVRGSEGADAEVAPGVESLGEQDGAAQGVESEVANGAVDAMSATAEPQETVADAQNTPVTAAEPAPGSEVVQEPAAESATIPAVVSQETAEDTQKRKRRSQSPPPSRADTPRKRARQDKDLPLTDVEEKDEIITTKDDAEWVEKHNGVDAEMVNAESKEVASSEGVEAGPTIVDVAKEEIKVAPVPEAQEETEDVKPEDEDTMMTDGDRSSGKDPRYKDLFSTSAKSADQMDTDTSFERDVAPATHPATTAIYIRNLMRPLNLSDLKSHILEMATVPGKTPHENTIVDFFVDHLRTHAFVSFDTVAAASRVRSEMHERTWPDELSRKPLWVDFIPSEKVEDWMGIELEPTNGGGRGTMKWEVTYQVDDDRNVTATLQEADTVPAMDRRPSAQVPSTFPTPHPGVLGAPLGPRAERAERTERSTSSWGGPPPLPRHKIDDTPTALDSVRTATITQPIIYFQTVTESVANKRLDNMDKVLSKHAPITPTKDINRYTFEDTDVLVDRGPEIFPGIRPPPGQRRGGFRGRGGFNDRGSSLRSDRFASDDRRAPPGHRGDSWRGGYADRGRDRDRNWRGAPRSNMPPSDRPWVRDRDQDQGFERERDRRGGFGYDRDERRRGDYGNPRFEGRSGGGYDRYEGRGRDEGRERRW